MTERWWWLWRRESESVRSAMDDRKGRKIMTGEGKGRTAAEVRDKMPKSTDMAKWAERVGSIGCGSNGSQV